MILETVARDKSQSFLLPEGNAPDIPPPREVGRWGELFLFAIFVGTRAFHPLIIENAKIDKKTPYAKVTPIIGECIFTFVVAQLMTLCIGGLQQWKTIWRPKPMLVFGLIGAFYGLGDILEVYAASKLSGDMYQVLLQSKLLITAVMMRFIKGTKTSRLQWVILGVVMCAMSVYSTAGKNMPKPIEAKYDDYTVEAYKDVFIDAKYDGYTVKAYKDELAATKMNQSDVLIGVFFTVAKVVVSCFCAVLSDKYMKDFGDEPIHVQLVQFKVSWFVVVFLFFLVSGDAWVEGQGGPLRGWNGATQLVLLSFAIKGWATMYLLAILDSVLKNIGEAASVLVTYLLMVFVFQKDVFQLPVLLMVLVVTLSVVSYIESKPVVDKATKYDQAINI